MFTLAELAAEFVHVYELLRDAMGSTAAALQSRVQQARIRWATARRGLWIIGEMAGVSNA